jgi:hypothetical protein
LKDTDEKKIMHQVVDTPIIISDLKPEQRQAPTLNSTNLNLKSVSQNISARYHNLDEKRKSRD